MKWRICAVMVFCLLLAGCGQKDPDITPVVRPVLPSGLAQDAVPAEEPDAKLLEEDGISPDGRYHLWLMKGEDSDEADNLIIWDSEENLIKWWDDENSVDVPSVIWSHDGTYLAINRTVRQGESITIVETENWTEWDVTLPDGTPLPERSLIPEEWGLWTEENVLRFVVNEEAAPETDTTYRCTVQIEEGVLTGATVYAEEILAEGYDFDDDGVLETITLEGNAGAESSFWVLRVMEDGEELWADSAAISHAGWNTIFACHINEDDYLLRYKPSMWQGFATYSYELFFLSESGEELVVMKNQVEFDESFDSSMHQEFDAVAVADFLWEVRGYLLDSTLLLSTEDGIFQSDSSWDQLVYYPFGASYEDLMSVESRDAMEEALRLYAETTETEQGVN